MTREEMLNKHFPPDGEEADYELADADTEVDDTSDEASVSTEVDDFDPFDPASVKAYIASKIAEILALTHSLGEATEPTEPEVEVAVLVPEPTPMESEDDSEDDGYDETAREQELILFRKEHPDVSTYAEQIKELMLSEGCRPEDAYHKIKAAEKETEIRSQKSKRAEAVRSIGSGSAMPPTGVSRPVGPKATTQDILDSVKQELGLKSLRG